MRLGIRSIDTVRFHRIKIIRSQEFLHKSLTVYAHLSVPGSKKVLRHFERKRLLLCTGNNRNGFLVSTLQDTDVIGNTNWGCLQSFWYNILFGFLLKAFAQCSLC